MDRFIELERKDEWLKIKYKGYIGWVRYLVPNIKNPSNVKYDIHKYIKNRWFTQIEKGNDCHYCESGCKTYIWNSYHSLLKNCDIVIECDFSHCQNMCYMKVQDTMNYKTIDILKELFIVSCCHSESFGTVPSQEKFDKIMYLLDTLDKKELIDPLINLCKNLITNGKKILLNPACGGKEIDIPADCDIVIDDTLIDIKCAKNNNKYEQLQLLGYTALLKYNNIHDIRINKTCIINLLHCEKYVYNIKSISNDNLLKYLYLLTNKYDSDKERWLERHQMSEIIERREMKECMMSERRERREMKECMICKQKFQQNRSKKICTTCYVFSKPIKEEINGEVGDLNKLKVPELKQLCKKRKLKRYSKLRKADLVKLLSH